MKSLVIFDLGETLIFYKDLALDWSSHYKSAINSALENLSITADDNIIEKASPVLAKYNTRLNPRINEIDAELIFGELLTSANIDMRFLKRFINEFFKYFQRRTQPEETSEEFLSFLRENKISSAVLTDVPYGMPKELVVQDLQSLINYIDFVLTSVESGFRKPSTKGIEIILQKFNRPVSQVMYVGNEKKDIDTAKSAGIMSVLLNKKLSAPEWGQDKTVNTLIEIKNFI